MGKSARYFIKRAISYQYSVRYELINTLCKHLVNRITIPHPGFHYLGRKTIYEWTYLEILQRCRQSLILSEQDEIWAFHIIALGRIRSWAKQTQWNNIIQAFDGSSRWVRVVAAFLCSVSDTRNHSFCRSQMTNGWYNWMNAEKMYELFHCIYPTFSLSSIRNMIDGEALMMGLVWACKHDQPIMGITYTSRNPLINYNISNIFSSDEMTTDTHSTVSMHGETELD
jgi:hypothetical protein